MSEITITINGRNYEISCDAGEEGRVLDLATYVDQKVKEISNSGAAYNDSHLMILASLLLANETFEAKAGIISKTPTSSKEVEDIEECLTQAREELARLEKEKEKVLAVTAELTERVEGLTAKVSAL